MRFPRGQEKGIVARLKSQSLSLSLFSRTTWGLRGQSLFGHKEATMTGHRDMLIAMDGSPRFSTKPSRLTGFLMDAAPGLDKKWKSVTPFTPLLHTRAKGPRKTYSFVFLKNNSHSIYPSIPWLVPISVTYGAIVAKRSASLLSTSRKVASNGPRSM